MLGWITAGLFFLLLIWGNMVAGMHAGMACPDWPLCQGKFLPPMRLDVWMEFMHRVIAALSTISLVLLARRRFPRYQGFRKAIPVLSLALICGEIVVGGVVVLLGLPVQLTTVHFMVGLTIFLLVLYMAFCDGALHTAYRPVSGYPALLFCFLLVLFSQASLGAYLRHSAAGLACPDFPFCEGTTLLPAVWDLRTTTNMSHRLLALGTLCSALLLWVASFLDRRLRGRQAQLLLLAVLVALQVGVGAAVVKSGLSYPITSLHLALTLGIIALGTRIWMLQTGQTGR